MLRKPIAKVPFWGDPSKLYKLTNWKPTYSFESMIQEMVSNELKEQSHDAK